MLHCGYRDSWVYWEHLQYITWHIVLFNALTGRYFGWAWMVYNIRLCCIFGFQQVPGVQFSQSVESCPMVLLFYGIYLVNWPPYPILIVNTNLQLRWLDLNYIVTKLVLLTASVMSSVYLFSHNKILAPLPFDSYVFSNYCSWGCATWIRPPYWYGKPGSITEGGKLANCCVESVMVPKYMELYV